MRKKICLTLTVVIIAFAVASCGKTTNRKLTNDWKVTSDESKGATLFQDGSKTTFSNSYTETNYKSTYSHTDPDGNTYSDNTSGTLKLNEFSIKKDGTWTWERTVFYAYSGNTNNFKRSGEWAFLGNNKGDDFKKNECVVFNVLNETTALTFGSGTTPYSSSISYLIGEKALFYKVKESKAKELQLESEYNRVQTDYTGTGTETYLNTLILKQK